MRQLAALLLLLLALRQLLLLLLLFDWRQLLAVLRLGRLRRR